MPRSAKLARIACTTRLAFDVYREAAKRARSRDWTLSRYIEHCVIQELRRTAKRGQFTSVDVQGVLDQIDAG